MKIVFENKAEFARCVVRCEYSFENTKCGWCPFAETCERYNSNTAVEIEAAAVMSCEIAECPEAELK